jgi:hypothetical protein
MFREIAFMLNSQPVELLIGAFKIDGAMEVDSNCLRLGQP